MKRSKLYCFLCFLNTCFQALGFTENPQDLQTTRANTLMDDADDLQRQLNNEARDKLYNGQPNNYWVYHIPFGLSTEAYIKKNVMTSDKKERSKIPLDENKDEQDQVKPDWNYKEQDKWAKSYPQCGGVAQSPVNLPTDSLVHATGPRAMFFTFYDVVPTSMNLVNDGRTGCTWMAHKNIIGSTPLSLTGEWPPGQRPLISGGAAHNRRFTFHSLVFHWPSEHTIGGLSYPLESQAIHISVEYKTLEDALKESSRDKLAILIVSNIYEFKSNDHDGLPELMSMFSSSFGKDMSPVPLSVLSPPLKEYAAYHGSLSVPPCTEAVLWLVRARALSITRKSMDTLKNSMTIEPEQMFSRLTQHLNDRKVFFFNV